MKNNKTRNGRAERGEKKKCGLVDEHLGNNMTAHFRYY